MKRQLFAILAVSLVAIMVLGACSSGVEPTTVQEVPTQVQEVPTQVQEAPTAVQETPAQSLTDAEMEALIAEKAHDQHTLDFILGQDKTAEEWSETLDRMIGYGAKISPEEKILIIEWLVNRK